MASVNRPSAREHAAILRNPDSFDCLRRKEDLLAEGVAALFGVKGMEAELLALYFQADRFTPVEAERWLQDRRLAVLQFTEAG
jgi:hypothetical protein